MTHPCPLQLHELAMNHHKEVADLLASVDGLRGVYSGSSPDRSAQLQRLLDETRVELRAAHAALAELQQENQMLREGHVSSSARSGRVEGCMQLQFTNNCILSLTLSIGLCIALT